MCSNEMSSDSTEAVDILLVLDQPIRVRSHRVIVRMSNISQNWDKLILSFFYIQCSNDWLCDFASEKVLLMSASEREREGEMGTK